jgi:pimeloyl-ACP methyl ester carboxylesterase
LPDAAADTHGEDLAAFVRALGLSKVRIVAHSSGAHTALFFAAKHPDMLVCLALNEPPATGLLAGVPDVADTLKEWGGRQAPAREAAKAAISSAPYLFSWMPSADRALTSAVPMPTRK